MNFGKFTFCLEKAESYSNHNYIIESPNNTQAIEDYTIM